MKNIHVIATSEKRIITVACATDIPTSLQDDEIIAGEWFYKPPEELKGFIDQNPEKLTYFLKGFSYWITFKVKGYSEHQARYGKLKRAINDFSKTLFKKIRGLAGRIAKEVRKILKPEKMQYAQQRNEKLVYQRLAYKTLASNNEEWRMVFT